MNMICAPEYISRAGQEAGGPLFSVLSENSSFFHATPPAVSPKVPTFLRLRSSYPVVCSPLDQRSFHLHRKILTSPLPLLSAACSSDTADASFSGEYPGELAELLLRDS